MATDEDSTNDRMSHYYGRELMFKARWEESIVELQRHLSLPRAQWQEERAASMRFIARCYRNLGKNNEAMAWAIKSTMECPQKREPWLELARCANAARDWSTLFWATQKCLAITQRGMTYISDGACWGSEPYDLGALAAHYLGLKNQAREWGQTALDLSPGDDRLRRNMEFYLE
jgi:tetratricopeptide (TPR) repeat protein